MDSAAVSELKASLSEYLAKVKAGEEVVVTERGRPVARLVPLGSDGLGADARLAELQKRGMARLGKEPLPADFWEQSRPRDAEGKALRALLDEREEGR